MLRRFPLLLCFALLVGGVGCALPRSEATPSHTRASLVPPVSSVPPAAEPEAVVRVTPEEEARAAEEALLAQVSEILAARADALSEPAQAEVAAELVRAEREHGLSALLLLAVIEQESSYRPRVTGPRGSVGLMQLRPFVAKDIARRHGLPYTGREDLRDPLLNVRLGVAFLAELTEEFDGDVELALAAYHIGPTRVRARAKRGWRPRGPYVRTVLSRYEGM